MLSLLSQRLAFRASTLGLNTALRFGVVANNAALLTSRAWSRSFVSTPQLAYPAKATTTTKKATTKKADAKPAKKATTTAKKTTAAKKKPARHVAAKKTPAARKRPAAKKAVKPKTTRIPKEDLPPKRPTTPYLRFFLRFRQTHASSGTGSVEATQVLARQSGEAWRQLSESEQAVYKDEYRLEQVDYYKRRKEYYENVPEGTLRAIKKARAKQGKKSLSSRGTYTGDKRPPSSFFLFLSDFRKTYQPTLTTRERIVETATAGGAAWRNLPAEEKARYHKMWEDSKAAAAAAKQ